MRRFLPLAVAATIAACSSQPTTPTSESAPIAAASGPAVAEPAASSTEPGAAATAATTSEVVPASAAKPEKSGKIPSGYRMEKRNGKELYCRHDTMVGSRFPQKSCFTRGQLEEIQKKTDSATRDMEQGMKVCAGIEGCGQN